MSYLDTLDFLFKQLANYHQSGSSAYKPGLDRIDSLLSEIGNPHKAFKSVHVAGTNGKGSVSHMIASILQESGFKTGLFTSPHLIDFRERIKINGQMIPEERVTHFVNQNKLSFSELNASFFEWTWAMACNYFASQNVDFVVVEVGLGGRLDATNSIIPEVSVITTIGMDHSAVLGDTLEEIAREKGGIIKANIPVVIGDVKGGPKKELDGIALNLNAAVHFRSDKIVETDLKGKWQMHNAQLAVRVSQLLNINMCHIVEGLLHVIPNTGLKGRLQLLNETPKIYCDTAHNVESWLALVSHFKQFDLHVILGFVNDKDVAGIVEILPVNWRYYVVAPSTSRAASVEEVVSILNDKGVEAKIIGDLKETFEVIKAKLDDDEILLIGGSNYLIGDLLKIL